MTTSLPLDGAIRLNISQWSVPWRYCGALVILGLATVIRLLLPLDSAPFLIYMPGMLVTGFFFGKGPGIAATLLSSAISILFFISPSSDIDLSWTELLETLLYAVISIALVYICDLLAKTLKRRDFDLEATRAAKAALEDSEAFLRSVLAASPDCIKVLDRDGTITFMNEGGLHIMEVEDFSKIDGCPWPDFWQDEHAVTAKTAISDARIGKNARFEGFCATMAGTSKWWDVSVSPIMGSGREVERILVTSRDITEQKRTQEQQMLLNHELGHRLKNMLAMIQAVANQTLRRASSLPEANAAFDARLVALGKAQDVLTGTAWASASITEIVKNALAPYEAERFKFEGPALTLSSRCSLALSLALHELATNAVKYGALSVETGMVVVRWQALQKDDQLGFLLEWRETGGPQVVKPERTGFGSFMIERSLSAYFKGSAKIEYADRGVVFTLDAPATRDENEFKTGHVEILVANTNIN